MSVLSLNGISVVIPQTWVFHEFTNLILGRPDSRAGVMQISTAFRDDAAVPLGHESCARIASAWVGADQRVTGWLTEGDLDSVLLGTISVRVDTEFKRVWYQLHGTRLILGVFGCPWDQRDSAEVKQALAEMGLLMRTARHDATV